MTGYLWYNYSVLQDTKKHNRIRPSRPLVHVLQDLSTSCRDFIFSEVLQMNYKKKRVAYARVNRALKSGEITKTDHCELCGRDCKHTRISGHHWNGYDRPLDLWWICQRCNNLLRGKHSGTLSMREATLLVKRDPRYGLCLECSKESKPAVLTRYRG